MAWNAEKRITPWRATVGREGVADGGVGSGRAALVAVIEGVDDGFAGKSGRVVAGYPDVGVGRANGHFVQIGTGVGGPGHLVELKGKGDGLAEPGGQVNRLMCPLPLILTGI